MKKFAFLIHPRDASDIARKFSITKHLPEKLIEAVTKRLRGRIGFTTCSKFDVYQKAEGYLVGLILTSKQIVGLPQDLIHRRILEAVLYAQNELGVELLGLGALTTTATDGGKWLIQQPEVRTGITHGDAYVVAVAEEDIEKIIDLGEFERKKIKIAILGTYGVVGRPLAEILAQKRYQLILVGRRETKMAELKKTLPFDGNVLFSTELASLAEADMVVTTTSSPTALLKPNHLKQGAIVYDIAQPINAPPDLVKARPDIIRIDGAYVNIPNIDLGFNLGPPAGTTLACLAGTTLEALEGKDKHYVGEINLSQVRAIRHWAKKYGFSPAPFTCFNQPIPLDRFKEISKKQSISKSLT